MDKPNDGGGCADASGRAPETETFAQYSLRLAREARLRKEAIATEALEKKRQIKEQRQEARRLEQERVQKAIRLNRENRRKQLHPALMELLGITQKKMQHIAEAKAAKSLEIERRKQTKLCVCCGDDRDIRPSGHCQQCWRELAYGIIETPPISERQLNSAACRVVRKGTEMS